MAHALYGYDGLCKNIHGHTYHLYITVSGEPLDQQDHPKNGMVMDFSVLKKIVKENITDVFDHALVLNANSSHKNIPAINQHFEKVIYTPFQPTCENLIYNFYQRLENKLPAHVNLFSLKLAETPQSFAEYYVE